MPQKKNTNKVKIIHCFENKRSCAKTVEKEPGFLLSNKMGGYLWLTGKAISRYQGWFFAPSKTMGEKIFRVIENIEIADGSKVSEIKNYFWGIKRKRGKTEENFYLPSCFNSLVYETNKICDVDIVLDIKESYDNSEDNRIYEISEEKELIMIKYSRNGYNVKPLYLAIKTNTRQTNKKNVSEWISREYSLDRERNSSPDKRYVFKALKLKAGKIVFSISENRNEAIKEARYIAKNGIKIEKLKRKERREKTKNKEIEMAYLCAQNALNNLLIYPCNKNLGVKIYAGLPWFFQFWPRDEAISLKALASFQKEKAEKILWRLIRSIGEDGNIGNSADAVGWVFKRAEDMIGKKRFSPAEVGKIKQSLEKAIKGLLENHTKNGFAMNGPQETWMDSIERREARIEIQALRLNMYKLAFNITKDKKYFELEKQLKQQVKEMFWNGQYLADGFNPDSKEKDFTIRPNIFMAAYVYPELLTKEEWVKCFKNVLRGLWLTWGGLSTIDKKHTAFHPQHTGEPSESYHQGDSWFYINNMAALVLHQTDKSKFKQYINKIIDINAKEILWHGIAGHHCELSSAKSFKPQGCLAQAWSSALYIELISALNK